jgi:preprotein translocase subunit SecB
MKIKHTNIHAKKIVLRNHGLDGRKYQLNPQYYKSISKVGEDAYRLELSVHLVNTESNPFPIDLFVEFETVFSFSEYDSQKEIDGFLNRSAIQMIFPFMRAAIHGVVSAALLPPLVLPMIDVRQFKEHSRSQEKPKDVKESA